jgi:hypothetical protein
MVPLAGNFRQQAQDNMRGARSSGQALAAGPPNMYFDHFELYTDTESTGGFTDREGYNHFGSSFKLGGTQDLEPEVQ